MQYELFRNDLAAELRGQYPEDLSRILSIVDKIAVRYNIQMACTALSVPEDDVPQMVKMHIAALAVENNSKATLSDRLRYLKNFFASVRKPYDQVTTNDIRLYLYNYKESRNVSDSTINSIRSNIHAFYNWCVSEDYMARNPAAKINVIKAPTPDRPRMNKIELEIMRSACRTLREKALVDFFYSTAARLSEVCNMLISDVDFSTQTVIIRHGKGDKMRKTYLNAESLVSLRKYLNSRSDDSPYLFVTEYRPHHQVDRNTIENVIRAIRVRSGINVRVTPHAFRRTTATHLLRAGTPIDQVRQLLGHAKLDTTLIYAETLDDDVRASHAKFA